VKKDTAQVLLKLSEEEYDVYASEFSNTRKYFWRELEFCKEYVKRGDKVLDIGCGNGRLHDAFDGTEIDYTGIDSSKELIAIAQKERGNNGTFIHGNALALPFADSTFDTVFSIAVLHHIPSKKYRKQFISEVHRVLKPGGVCVLTSWNTLQWKFAKAHAIHTLKKLCGLSRLDFGDLMLTFGKEKRKRYVHSLSKSGLRKLFTQNMFSDISVKEVRRKSGYANLVVVAHKTL
jgi:ubiquinone/menaquinone biosynthesis C-methylase UbiE